MSLFAWRDELSVHHPQIDSQHKSLLRLADDLHAAMMRGAGRTVIGETLGKLIDYTASHFRDEEGLMRSTGYPQLPAHKAEHDALTKQVLELKKGYAASQVTITVETMNFLRDWLNHHIMGSDFRLAQHIARSQPALARTGSR
jgi:hemerythrin